MSMTVSSPSDLDTVVLHMDDSIATRSRSGSGDGRCFDRKSIAGLSLAEISTMCREDLVSAILVSDLPFLDLPARRRLEFVDRAALERLAHLGRRCCRQRAD